MESAFIESIKIENGSPVNLRYHQRRFDQTRAQFYKGAPSIDLLPAIEHAIEKEGKPILRSLPAGFRSIKCRIEYGAEIEEIEFRPYALKPIRSLRLVYDDQVSYGLKFKDRRHLITLFEKREDCDDILIVKNGFITDTFYGNVVLYQGEMAYTPWSPLLNGTQRQALLEEGRLTPTSIKVDDLARYDRIEVVNAMIRLGEITLALDQVVGVTKR